MSSYLDKITDNFNGGVIAGFFSFILLVSVTSYFDDYYLKKIPDDAEYEIVFEKYRTQDGSADYYEWNDYKNDIYEKYEAYASYFRYSPIIILFLFSRIKHFLEERFNVKRNKDHVANKTDKYYEEPQFEDTLFCRYVSGFYLSALLLVPSYIIYIISKSILNSII